MHMHANAMALPLYGCRSCVVHDAIVFCLCCIARLCLHCDAAVHTYTGCPGPAEMARLISADPPQPHQDLEAWLADRLPRLQPPPPPPPDSDWDVAMETARLEKMLADSCCYTTEQPPPPPPPPPPEQQQPQAVSAVQTNYNGFPFCGGVFPAESAGFMPPPPPPQTTTTTTCAAADHDQMLLDASAMANKKREQRERAKQRYNDKKKNRRFGRQILYASRKARADTRKRVRGRFAKVQHDDHPINPQTDDGPCPSTSTPTSTEFKK